MMPSVGKQISGMLPKKIGDFPFSGAIVPADCFAISPEAAERLRQVFCGPYRIVYESIGDEIHVLAIRHSRMLVTATDTYWN